MRTFLTSLIAILITSSAFAQTEYDYYEKQRLERKEKKVKLEKTFSFFDSAIMQN